jgi:putative ABC transport system permease protein
VRLLRLLGVRRLRTRPLRAVFAVLAVAAGTAMAVNVVVVRTSVERSIDDYARALSGPTELRVVGAVTRGGIVPGTVDAVAGTEGVARAVPVVQGVTLLDRSADRDDCIDCWEQTDEPVTVLGVDCRAAPLLGVSECRPGDVADRGDTPLFVGPGVEPGRRVATRGAGVRLDGVPVLDGLGDVGEGRVVVFGLAAAQRLFDRGDRVDVVYVQVEPGTDAAALRPRLATAVGEQNAVLDAGQGTPELLSSVSSILPLFTLIALFGLGIGAMLVHNTTALTLEERRRELAVVSALGGTRGALAGTAMGEAALVGALGGLLGAAGGALLAGPIVANLSAYTERRAGVPLTVHASAASVVLAVVLGVVVAVVAAWFPVRRAVRADVAAELSGGDRRDEAAAPALVRRFLVWSLFVVAGLAAIGLGTRNGGIEPWQVPAGALGFALAALTTIMAGAQLAPLMLPAVARVVSGTAAGRMALSNLAREPRRTGTMVVAVATASTTAFITAGYLNGAQAGQRENVVRNLEGVQVSVVEGGGSAHLDTGMSPALLDALGDVPGAEPVARRGVSVLTGGGSGAGVWVSAYEDPWLDGRAVAGTLDRAQFEQGRAIVNTALARRTGLRPGDTLRLAAPAGMVELPVQAVVVGGGAVDPGAQVPFDVFTDHWDVPPLRRVTVEPTPGTSLAELEQAVLATVRTGDFPDGEIDVLAPSDVADENDEWIAQSMAPFWTLQRGLLVVSFVAVLSTLLLVGLQRRREMAMLGAVGAEPRMLGRMVLVEAGVVSVLAVLLTATGGMVLLWALNRVAPLLVGFESPLRPDWWSLVVWGAVSAVVTLLAAAWPARQAARTEVLAGLQAD